MNMRSIIAAVLLLFVTVSLVVLVVKEVGRGDAAAQAGDGSSAEVAAGVPSPLEGTGEAPPVPGEPPRPSPP